MASQITSLITVYWIVCAGADQRKHQSSASPVFVLGIHRWPVKSQHKGPVMRKMFPFGDVIISHRRAISLRCLKLLFCISNSKNILLNLLPYPTQSNELNLFTNKKTTTCRNFNSSHKPTRLLVHSCHLYADFLMFLNVDTLSNQLRECHWGRRHDKIFQWSTTIL